MTTTERKSSTTQLPDIVEKLASVGVIHPMILAF